MPFGARLRDARPCRSPGGLVVLGSGAIPLATDGRPARRSWPPPAPATAGALANNRYSADVVAIACGSRSSPTIPDLPADNALPRWLAEVAGYDVSRPASTLAAGDRHRLTARPRPRSAGPRAGRPTLADRRPGASSAASTASGPSPPTARAELAARRPDLRGDAGLARAVDRRPDAGLGRGARPARSAAGRASRSDAGRASVAPGRAPRPRRARVARRAHLAGLGDAAIVDTRVLLAHRLGRGRGGLAGRRGPVRLGPAAARRGSRPMAARR